MSANIHAIKLTDSIIKKLGVEGLKYFKIHGELPAIVLSSEEMEFVRGAGLWKDFTGRTFKEFLNDKLPDTLRIK